ncbi:MAG TPA: hypothetical protein PKB06_07605, partial [Actinotalea sp.]|nr:hypothetical protein [Actinotalea sp.]
MSTRLLLDGTDLRSLMLRVRDEMGPGATIVRAERVRTGGIAGFFAREHYELTVEVPDPPERPPAHARPAPAGGPERPAGHSAEPVGLDALLAAADAIEATPHVSTAGDSFAEVLASMQRITADGPADSAPRADADPGPARADAEPGPRRYGADPPEVVEPSEPVVPVWTPSVPVVVERPVAPAAGPSPVPAAVPAPAPAPDPHPFEDERAERPEANVAALLELGVPTRLLARFDGTGQVPLSELVATFDRAPAVRLEPGALVVVAGPAEVVLRTATAMAERAGLDGRDVVLAGDLDPGPGHGRRVQTTAAAARVRA